MFRWMFLSSSSSFSCECIEHATGVFFFLLFARSYIADLIAGVVAAVRFVYCALLFWFRYSDRLHCSFVCTLEFDRRSCSFSIVCLTRMAGAFCSRIRWIVRVYNVCVVLWFFFSSLVCNWNSLSPFFFF